MRYDLIGSMLLFVSALLYAARHMATACFIGSRNDWSVAVYRSAYSCVGRGITPWAIAALVGGIVCLGYGVYRELKKGK